MTYNLAATPRICFRQLLTDEEETGYGVIIEAVDWLREKRIKMWEHPLPGSVYSKRQESAQNYGLFVDGELAVIASLVSAPSSWTDLVVEENAPWLSTLATARAFRGRQLGRRTVEEICTHLEARGHPALYLDCGSPFLEAYYLSLGFAVVEVRVRRINRPPVPAYDCECTLMRRPLP